MHVNTFMFFDFSGSHLYKCVLAVTTKAIPFSVKGLIMSISIDLTCPGTRLVFAVPLTLTTDTAR